MDFKPVMLYGAGNGGIKALEALRRFDVPVLCFCDSDPDKKGKIIQDVIVKSPDEINLQYNKGEYQIIITILTNQDKIKNELISHKIFDSSDFFNGDYAQFLIEMIQKQRKKNSDIQPYISAVEKNFIHLDEQKEKSLKEVLLSTWFLNEDFLKTENGQKDFSDHLYNRLELWRKRMSWIESIKPLKNAKVLEVGCGTGTSTIALCEQGAEVVAVDLDEQGLDITRKRLEIYGLNASVKKLSAADIKMNLSNEFDFIIYPASLEHMTYEERLQTLKSAYDMINDEQFIFICDTPNRLWHTDNHTSLEPFFNWLPHDLAMDYSKLTKRQKFNNGFDRKNINDIITFNRFGTGLSYHEFDIAIGIDNYEVVSSLNEFYNNNSSNYYECLLKIYGHQRIHDGFYQSSLNIALKRK